MLHARFGRPRFSHLALTIAAALFGLMILTPASNAQDTTATPTVPWSCDMATPVATPGMPHDGMGMDMGSPQAGGMTMDHEIDQMYIDMMIQHHASIIALSQAALPNLTDERLITIAESIISAQTAEIDELRGYRADFYGTSDSMPMDEHMMDMMMMAMPGMGSMDEMMFQMDEAAQVAAICSAENVDLAFIDLVIPHHEMAVRSSETVAQQAVHPEIKAFAERVIEAQAAEIVELESIKADLEG